MTLTLAANSTAAASINNEASVGKKAFMTAAEKLPLAKALKSKSSGM
jgi:hypothetical protein